MEVITVEVPELGNRCHLVHDGARALVVDPPRDLDPVERAAEAAGVDIAAVADTHVHSDYVSGAAALARRHRAPYLLSGEERVDVDRVPVHGGDVVPVGALEVRVIATPGHTLHHQSFVVRHGEAEPHALFSGGSLLHGTVGRTDLVDPLLARLLGRAQWQSAQHQVVLPSATSLHPTHGFGSLCSSTAVDPDPQAGTVGHERRTNPALNTPREPYVDALVDGFGPAPSYYTRLARLNRSGAAGPVPVPAEAGPDEVVGRARAGGWVVDVRARSAYAKAHLPGTVGIELREDFATYAGWVTPWGADLTLVGDRREDLQRAVHDLGQIGVDVARTHVLGPVVDWPGCVRTERTDWQGYAQQRRPNDVVLDVRHAHEHDADHLPEARNVPLPDLWRRAARLPPGRIWVHCRTGFRATTAAGLLARLGREVVLVDDDWSRVGAIGLATDRAA